MKNLLLTILIIQSFIILAQDKLFGISQYNRQGEIYSMNFDGTDMTKIHDFSNGRVSDNSALIKVNNKLYGLVSKGGDFDKGALFYYDLSNKAYVTIYEFDGALLGGIPQHSLTFHKGKLWGVTLEGGNNNTGIVFRIDTLGQNYEVIHHFETDYGSPLGGLTVNENYLYGWAKESLYRINITTLGFEIYIKTPEFQGVYKPLFIGNNIVGVMRETTLFNRDYGIMRVNKNNNSFSTQIINGAYLEPGEMTLLNNKYWFYSKDSFYSVDTVNFYLRQEYTDSRYDGYRNNGLIAYKGVLLGVKTTVGEFNYGSIFSFDPQKINRFDVSPVDTLYSFSSLYDGQTPRGQLLTEGDKVWGLTYGSGYGFSGTIFEFQPIIEAGYGNHNKLFSIGIDDGADSRSGLIYANNKLWGTALVGGIGDNYGLVFSINEDGSDYLKVHEFNDNDGKSPYGGVIRVNDDLYGVTRTGGKNDRGVIYSINLTNGFFTKLYDFEYSSGSSPHGELLYHHGKLYGSAISGGQNSSGVIYSIALDGSEYTVLHNYKNVSGERMQGKFKLLNNKLWGLTEMGGIHNEGVLFSINLDGTNYQVKFDFESGTSGKKAIQRLLSIGSTLYGTTNLGGVYNDGTFFKYDTEKDLFEVIVNFKEDSTGAHPWGFLTKHNDKIYGTTMGGGTHRNGVVFTLDTLTEEFEVLTNFISGLGRPYGSMLVNDDYDDLITDVEFKENHIGELDFITCYPNPFQDFLYLNTSAGWVLEDILGTVIASGTGSIIDVAGLENGLYLLQVENTTFKVVKN